jgi:ribosome-associated protein
MPTTETRKMVLAAAAVCEDKKAENTRVLELDPADSGFTDFFLITSGTNTRQTVAISDEIELKMKREFGTYANSVEGRRTGEWILLDYVDFVVHIFVEEKRAFYDIERLRKSARSLDVTDLKATLTEATAAARRARSAPKAAGAGAEESAETETVAPTKKAARSTGAKQAAPRKTATRKAAVKKTATRTSATKASTTKAAAAKKAPAKKSATRLAAAGEAAAKRPAANKATAKKTAAKKTRRTTQD